MGCEDILKSTLTSEFVSVDFSTEAAPVVEEGGKKGACLCLRANPYGAVQLPIISLRSDESCTK